MAKCDQKCSLFPYEIEEVVSLQDVKQQVGWSVSAFRLPNAWQHTQGEGVVVAILDTGIDLDHPDLNENIVGGFNFIKPGTTALLWFRRIIGVLLIGLGLALVTNKMFRGLGKVEHFGSDLSKKGKGTFGKFFMFGFGYTLVGIGCVAPLVGGLSLFALSSGGLSSALIVFILASTVMALLMVLLSIIAGFARESLTQTLVTQIKPIRLIGGFFLILMGAFNIIITLSERLLQILP